MPSCRLGHITDTPEPSGSSPLAPTVRGTGCEDHPPRCPLANVGVRPADTHATREPPSASEAGISLPRNLSPSALHYRVGAPSRQSLHAGFGGLQNPTWVKTLPVRHAPSPSSPSSHYVITTAQGLTSRPCGDRERPPSSSGLPARERRCFGWGDKDNTRSTDRIVIRRRWVLKPPPQPPSV
jgi:hypothetical protein